MLYKFQTVVVIWFKKGKKKKRLSIGQAGHQLVDCSASHSCILDVGMAVVTVVFCTLDFPFRRRRRRGG